MWSPWYSLEKTGFQKEVHICLQAEVLQLGPHLGTKVRTDDLKGGLVVVPHCYQFLRILDHSVPGVPLHSVCRCSGPCHHRLSCEFLPQPHHDVVAHHWCQPLIDLTSHLHTATGGSCEVKDLAVSPWMELLNNGSMSLVR